MRYFSMVLLLFISLDLCVHGESYFELNKELVKARKLALSNKKDGIVLSDAIGVDLSNLNLTEIPEDIAKYKNAKFINLSGNNISLTKLDYERLSVLDNLIEVSLVGNKVSKISDHVVILNKANSLKIISLAGNEITEISHKFSDLNVAIALNLSFSEINSVPDAVLNNEKIKYLFLGFNKIDKLPSFEKMKSLKVLDLSNNPMVSYKINPDSFPASLEEITLTGTGITTDSVKLLSDRFPDLKIIK